MGVLRLHSFLKQNSAAFNSTNLTQLAATMQQPLRLLIDGYSLVFELYLFSHSPSASPLEWLHGGDYTEFANNVNQYFGAFKQSNILLTVVFDGCSDPKKHSMLLCCNKNWCNSFNINSFV